MSKIYLASYRPIISTRFGKSAVVKYGLRPFIDGSCRREPDFESFFYPSITALCRAGKFAPKLKVGDKVIYLTVRMQGAGQAKVWYLVAFLEVVERFESHQDAAKWYCDYRIEIPSNCIVSGNLSINYCKTSGEYHDIFIQSGCDAAIGVWDGGYKKRAKSWPVFLACKTLFCDLDNPPLISSGDLYGVFERIPGTQNPRVISPAEANRLMWLATDPKTPRYP